MTSPGDKVAVVGCGLIGRSWAMIFASAGNQVGGGEEEKGNTPPTLFFEKRAYHIFAGAAVRHGRGRRRPGGGLGEITSRAPGAGGVAERRAVGGGARPADPRGGEPRGGRRGSQVRAGPPDTHF